MSRRILVIDDDQLVHDVFRKILTPNHSTYAALTALEKALFGDSIDEEQEYQFEIESVYQGPEGVLKIEEAFKLDDPYAIAFVDMRMPPGWDGLTTVQKILEVDPAIQIVICTAYSAYVWDELTEQISANDHLSFLKKPFDPEDLILMANDLVEVTNIERSRLHVAN